MTTPNSNNRPLITKIIYVIWLLLPLIGPATFYFLTKRELIDSTVKPIQLPISVVYIVQLFEHALLVWLIWFR